GAAGGAGHAGAGLRRGAAADPDDPVAELVPVQHRTLGRLPERGRPVRVRCAVPEPGHHDRAATPHPGAVKYLLRKVALYAFIAWSAITLNFLIPRLMPGDPVTLLVERMEGRIEPEAMAAIAESCGSTDDPWHGPEWAHVRR